MSGRLSNAGRSPFEDNSEQVKFKTPFNNRLFSMYRMFFKKKSKTSFATVTN